MTIQEARERLAEIEAIKGDDEAAHGAEDDFRHAVLEAIASGSDDAQELAAIALKTSDIDFARWCA